MSPPATVTRRGSLANEPRGGEAQHMSSLRSVAGAAALAVSLVARPIQGQIPGVSPLCADREPALGASLFDTEVARPSQSGGRPDRPASDLSTASRERSARRRTQSPFKMLTMPLAIMEMTRTGAVSTSTTTQMPETEITAGRVCLNPLPRIFLFILNVFTLVSEISCGRRGAAHAPHDVVVSGPPTAKTEAVSTLIATASLFYKIPGSGFFSTFTGRTPLALDRLPTSRAAAKLSSCRASVR